MKSKGHHEPEGEDNREHENSDGEKREVRAEASPEDACRVVAGLMPLRSGNDYRSKGEGEGCEENGRYPRQSVEEAARFGSNEQVSEVEARPDDNEQIAENQVSPDGAEVGQLLAG